MDESTTLGPASDNTPTQTVAIASDLHLYCRRSQAEAHIDTIFESARNADRFVLNGDIFDFRWSVFPSRRETIDHALAWLDDLTAVNPACHFHYVLGNHDTVHEFVDALSAYAKKKSNLSWYPHYVKLGDTMFLHGDVAHRKMNGADFSRHRALCMNDPHRGEFLNRLWDAAFGVRMHKALSRIASPTKTVVRRVRYYLDTIGHGPDSGTREVYFGHTHVPVDGYWHRGLRYHNGGAPMPGMQFRVLTTRIAV